MSDLFGFKRRAAAKHEAELKLRLADRLKDYAPEEVATKAEFTNVDFGEGVVRVKKQEINIEDPWSVNLGDTTHWHRANMK